MIRRRLIRKFLSRSSLALLVICATHLAAFDRTIFADDEVELGRLLYSDPNLSLNRNQSCATCHSLTPALGPGSDQPLSTPGFVDPESVHTSTPVSRGSVSGKFGALNAPSVGYAAFSPEFHWDPAERRFVGGQFWNGRAANLQAQAGQPVLNPAEMAMPSKWALVTRLKENSTYRQLFAQLYGLTLDGVEGNELASATNTPPAGVLAIYDAATQAISQFERDRSFSKFTSKFDFYLAGMTTLNSNELDGLSVFVVKAGCAACHTSDAGTDAQGHTTPPLFSNFTYHNVGLPRNVNIPGNPPVDLGLGGRPDIAATPGGTTQLGKHKVVSLRNVAVTPPYGHNGVFTNLEQVVHFYNTRDRLGRVDSNTNAGFGITGWPEPEVPQNLNVDLTGTLHLTTQEEADVVAFLRTLTDGYPETGADPSVPPGTPSPFANTAIPQIPARLAVTAPGTLLLSGHLGIDYRVEYFDSLSVTNFWEPLLTTRLLSNSLPILDTNWGRLPKRFYRAVQSP